MHTTISFTQVFVSNLGNIQKGNGTSCIELIKVQESDVTKTQ